MSSLIFKIIIAFLIAFSSKVSAEDDQFEPYLIGEKLTFDIKYGIISAGEASLEVNSLLHQDTIPSIQIISKARTNSFFDRIFRVRDEIESVFDREKLVSYRFTKRLQEGRYRQFRIHYYYPHQNLSVYMRYSYSRQEFQEETMDIVDNTHDILSAFYWLRHQDLEPGISKFVNVTADGENYVAEIIVHETEVIDTIFGKKECLKIEPVLKGDALFKQTGNIHIWITNDEYKIPVKLQSRVIFGSFHAILSKAENVPYQ